MKSFATFALLAVAACAVDIEVEQSYKKIFNAPSAPSAVFSNDDAETNHTHEDGTIHVNVWETIDAELMELMNEVTALMAAVTAQGSTLMETQMNFQGLMESVTELRETNAENSAAIAMQKAIDASQDAKIGVLTSDVTKLEHKVSELNNKVTLLKLRVADLPDLSSLNERLMDIIEKNMQLMMDVMTQAENITDVQETVVEVTATLDQVEMDRMDVQDALDLVTQGNIDNAALILINTNQVDQLQMDIEKQTVVADFIFINEDRLTLDQPTQPVGSFNLCDGETLEFHLAMSDEPGIVMGGTTFSSDNKVVNVKLLEGTEEVAVSNVTDTVVRGHQHSLFYKYTNDTGNAITYMITVDADTSDATASFATIEK